MSAEVLLRSARADEPQVLELIDGVQAHYRQIYGSPDESPWDPEAFVRPRGTFVVAEFDGEVIGMGGWRRGAPGPADAEIKRMFVHPRVQRRGVARVLLAELERRAVEAGVARLVLETGTRQPEAIALYRSCGYTDVERFGYYACSDASVYLGKML